MNPVVGPLVSEAEKEKIYDDLCDALILSLQNGEIFNEEGKESANFILEKLELVHTKQELFSFLEALANKYPIYSNVYLLIKSEMANSENISQIQSKLHNLK